MKSLIRSSLAQKRRNFISKQKDLQNQYLEKIEIWKNNLKEKGLWDDEDEEVRGVFFFSACFYFEINFSIVLRKSIWRSLKRNKSDCSEFSDHRSARHAILSSFLFRRSRTAFSLIWNGLCLSDNFRRNCIDDVLFLRKGIVLALHVNFVYSSDTCHVHRSCEFPKVQIYRQQQIYSERKNRRSKLQVFYLCKKKSTSGVSSLLLVLQKFIS